MSRKPVPDSADSYSTGSDCADTPEIPPRDLSWKVRHERINVDGNHLSFDGKMTGLYVAAKPLSPENYYFEIEIVDPGNCSCIAMGIVPDKYPLDAAPGWRAYSVGYHADDGCIYKESGENGIPFGAKCNIGDIMGCGIQFSKSEEERRKLDPDVQVLFTRNGKEVGTVTVPYPPGGLYPAVGMESDGAKVRLILDAEWQYELHASNLDGLTPSYPGSSPIHNPPVPFVHHIGGLYPNKMIVIHGIPFPNPSRFTVYIQQGNHHEPHEIAMCVDSRFWFNNETNTLVRNHKQGGWGSEERTVPYFPFAPNVPFEMTILVEHNHFTIAINNQHMFEFHHRLHPVAKYDMIRIDGDVRLTQVRFQG
ncbi:uncharacterized protein LOC127858321 isoform X2 [Dreissena polymorpha]|nr:uncharacterized protein LOC127858321 isoform X2 [Dreissena polymorpha]